MTVLDTLFDELNSLSDAQSVQKVEVLNKLAWLLRHDDAQKALALGEQAYALSQSLDYTQGLLQATCNIGYAHLFLNHYQETLSLMLNLLENPDLSSFPTVKANIFNAIGLTYHHLSLHADGMEYILQALAIAQDLGDLSIEGRCHNDLGRIYSALNNPEGTKQAFYTFWDISRRINDIYGEARALNNIASFYLNTDKPAQALSYINQGLEIIRNATDVIGGKALEATLLVNAGEVQLKTDNLQQAIHLFEQSLALCKDIGDTREEGYAMYSLGTVHQKMGNLNLAEQYYHEAFALAEAIDAKNDMIEYHKVLADLYERQDQFRSALYHLRAYHKMREIAFNEQADSKLKGLQISFETETARREAEIYQLKNVSLQEEVKERRMAEVALTNALRNTNLLYNIGRILTTSHNLENTLETVLGEYLRTFNLKNGNLSLFDANYTGSQIYTLYLNGVPTSARNRNRRKLHPLHHAIIDTKNPIISHAPLKNPLFKNYVGYLKRMDICAVLIIPLLVRDKVIGLMSAEATDPDFRFTDEIVSLSQSLADQISTTLENRQLLVQEQQQRQVSENLQKIAAVLNQQLDPEVVLGQIIEVVRDVVRFDSGGVFLVDQNGSLELSMVGGDTDPSYLGRTLPADGLGPVAQVFKLKSALIIGDVFEEKDWEWWEDTHVIRSWVGVPLLIGNEAIGVLTADSNEVNNYTWQEAELMQAFANHAATAIHNARLYQQAQQDRQTAEAASQAKSVFLANMSHELRTPLNSIIGFAQLLNRAPDLTPDHREQLNIIKRSGEHLLRLINDVLDLSKIEAGRHTMVANDFELHRLLQDLYDMFSLKATEKKIKLRIEYPESLPRFINTDELKLRQVLINLLSNAIKFTLDGEVVLLAQHAAQPDKSAVLQISVRDTGPGITPDELETLFDPFVQTKSGREAAEGTGLGLPISKKFIGLMGGDLTVISEPDAGSTFTFNIPVTVIEGRAATVSPEQAQTELLLDGAGQKLLIVDDRLYNRQLLCKMLKTHNFALKEAVNGRQAVELWEIWQPDFILMDIRMPVMNGIEAIQLIRADNAPQPVIIALTAGVSDEGRAEINTARADHILHKPINFQDLYQILSTYLTTESLPATEPLTPTTNDATLNELLSLPPENRISLQQAIETVDMTRIGQEIDDIRALNGPLATLLETTIDNFEYEKILAVIA